MTSAPEAAEPGTPGPASSGRLAVVVEVGARWAFASAVDWPGWCRRGRGEEAAVEALMSYRERYAAVVGGGVGGTGPVPAVEGVDVVERVAGGASTDFGAPGAVADADRVPVGGDGDRLAGLLGACWAAFDRAVACSPAQLRTGPRGGGRHRDAIAAHVAEAERSYARKVGVRLAPSTPWTDQRAAVLGAVGAGEAAAPASPWPWPWPLRYLVRRCAWHVTDHLWELEDRRP